MMRKSVWHIMGGLLLALTACKKTPIPELPEGNDPIYAITGQVDGDDIDYKVGLESVVLNRGVKNNNGVISYYSEMESVANGEKIRVEFMQLETPQGSERLEVFNNLNVPFMVHQISKVRFDFDGVGNQGEFLYIIDKGGNSANSQTYTLTEYGFDNVRVYFNDYGPEVFNFTIKHGFKNNELVSSFITQGAQDSILLIPSENHPMHEWYIDGVLASTEQNYYGPIGNGIHRINHRVMDEYNNKSETSRLVRFKGGKQFWAMNVIYHDEYEFEPYNYGRVVVSMFKDNEWYSSDFALENKGEIVKIDNIDLVYEEGNNQPLVAFDVDFNALLYNDDMSESLTLSNMKGKFIVGLE